MADDVVIDSEILAARILQAKAAPALDITALPTAEARRLANAAAMIFNDGAPFVARVEDFMVPTAGGDLQLRLYQPESARGCGAVLYIHGGGWFACNVDTHDRMMRVIADTAGVSVVGVDFRLSPEHPFPAAFDDCRAAWAWLQEHAAEQGIDPARVAVAGDSAGANLALALSVHLRDTGQFMPVGGALLYGCFAPGLDTDTMRRFGQGGYGLTAARMGWYWDNYLGPATADPPVLATPLHADLTGLPPQFLGIAEADTVSDDSRLLLARLEAARVPAEFVVWRGATHGFLQMTRDVALARTAVEETARALARWTA